MKDSDLNTLISNLKALPESFVVGPNDNEQTTRKKNAYLGMLQFDLLHGLAKSSKDTQAYVINYFEQHPKIYADVVSALDNANCSCKGRVSGYLSYEPKILTDLIETSGASEDVCFNLNILLGQIAEKYEKAMVEQEAEEEIDDNYLGGQILTIKADPEVYDRTIKGFVKNKQEYKGLFIVDQGESWKIFFY